MPSPTCSQLKTDLAELQTLQHAFTEALDHARTTGDMAHAQAIKIEIERKMTELKEKLWPFKELPKQELKKQYESQKEIFQKTGIMERLSTPKDKPTGQAGELGLPRSSPEAMVWGIKGIDRKEYPFPSFEAVSRMMQENKEILTEKTAQGFTTLLITPFGMKLKDLIGRYKQTILRHHQDNKLFATKKNPSDPNESLVPLELDETEPVWIRSEYNANCDENGALIYDPREFSSNHCGTTKQALLASAGGWRIQLIEDMPNIPRATEDEAEKQKRIKGGRPKLDTTGSSIKKYIKQGETIPSPREYLKAMQTDPSYRHERGMTPEDQLTYAILHLEQTNQVIDDRQGNGSISYQLGACFTSGDVPFARWGRDNRQAIVGRVDPVRRDDGYGVRSGVRVGKG